jgi:hypothetical protein
LNDIAAVNEVPVLVEIDDLTGLPSDVVESAKRAADEFDERENAVRAEDGRAPLKSRVLACLLFAVASLNVDGESRVTLGGYMANGCTVCTAKFHDNNRLPACDPVSMTQ